MRFDERLSLRIKNINSHLCVGLDPREELIKGDILKFLIKVVAQTNEFAACYKPNIAYYEALGIAGYEILYQLIKEIPKDIPVILDVKRGDIPQTQRYYAKAYFERLNVDAVTLNPYLGRDSIEPFLNYEGKGVYLLGITSNRSARDIQMLKVSNKVKSDRRVFDYVIEMLRLLENSKTGIGLVIGATNINQELIKKIPDVPLLVPGIGSQAGELKPVSKLIKKMESPVVINVSRSILFSDDELSFKQRAKKYRELINDAIK
ncbi:MAG: orotidine-5'-phosphate decarboxylase [Candidatus Hydrogenedentota bacterium]